MWGSIPGSGRSPGGGNGNPLQYSCQENPMDREAWQATSIVGGVIFTNIKGLGFCEQSHRTFSPDTRSAFSRTG